ncbi:hypothetical protein VTN00DRAFT_5061 [Thermoascus crustaceus]|uniref:uncharacterized protein n=1 Tax=Thermoascus crustaceus TaxID=5088 RepID=UPI0037439616
MIRTRVGFRVSGTAAHLGGNVRRTVLGDARNLLQGNSSQRSWFELQDPLQTDGAGVCPRDPWVRDTAKGDAAAQSLNTLKGQVSVQIEVTDDESVDAILNMGTWIATKAFLPLFCQSSAPQIVVMTSSSGSLTYMSDKTSRHYGPYATELCLTKAALNIVMVEYANHPKVVGAEPRFLATTSQGIWMR